MTRARVWPRSSKSENPISRAGKVQERQRELRQKALRGGVRYLPKLRQQNKLTVRERLHLLLDEGSFVEDGLFANVLAEDLPADGVVTGLGTIDGRHVAVMANDPTVKAGSWGARTVEKIVRIQETAGCGCRSSTSSTLPVPASRTRSTCSPGGATRAASSSTRCSSRAGCRRSACSSAPRPPAARTSRRSATW